MRQSRTSNAFKCALEHGAGRTNLVLGGGCMPVRGEACDAHGFALPATSRCVSVEGAGE